MSDGWGGGELRRCRTECHNDSALCVIQKMVGWAGLGGMCVRNRHLSPVVVVPLGKTSDLPLPKLLLFNRHKDV